MLNEALEDWEDFMGAGYAIQPEDYVPGVNLDTLEGPTERELEEIEFGDAYVEPTLDDDDLLDIDPADLYDPDEYDVE
jgi:hypothetical protein